MSQKQVAFSMDPEKYEALVAIAKREKRSLSSQIALFVESSIDNRVAAESGSQIDMSEIARRSES